MKENGLFPELLSSETVSEGAKSSRALKSDSAMMLSDEQLNELNQFGNDLLMMKREFTLLSLITPSESQLEELIALYKDKKALSRREKEAIPRSVRNQAFSSAVLQCCGDLEKQLLSEFPSKKELVQAAAVNKCLRKAAELAIGEMLVRPEPSDTIDFFRCALRKWYKKERLMRWREKLASKVFSYYSKLMFVFDFNLKDEDGTPLPSGTNNECLCSAVDLTIAKMKYLTPESFDPEKGSFSNYFLRSLKTAYSDERESYWQSLRDKGLVGRKDDDKHGGGRDESQGTGLKWVYSLINEDGEEIEVSNTIFSNLNNNGSEEQMLDRIAVSQQLTAMILNFWSLLDSHSPKEEIRNPEESFRLFQMWYSEISVLMLKLELPVWNEQDTQRALSFSYLDCFLKENFHVKKNQTLDIVRNSAILSVYQPKILSDPVIVEWNYNGFLPAVIPQDYIFKTWSKEERKKWSRFGYPSDSVISESRKKYVTWYHQLMRNNCSI